MLSGKKVAILTENGFEEEELTSPKLALEAAGALVQIISPQKGKVKAWDHDHWSIELTVDLPLDQALYRAWEHDPRRLFSGTDHANVQFDHSYSTYGQGAPDSFKKLQFVSDKHRGLVAECETNAFFAHGPLF